MTVLPHDLEPWLGWLLVALCRQRARQTWLVMVNAQRLAGVDEDAGPVPGLAGWTYRFHGLGLCLNGPDHEALDVDFHDDEGATIDPYFFAYRVLGLDPAPDPEAEMRRWLPTPDLIALAIEVARRRGFLAPRDGTHEFTLSDALEAEHTSIASEDFTTWRSMWSGTPGEGAHAEWLLGVVAERPRSGVIQALAILREDLALDALVALLKGPIDASTGAALRALDGMDAAPTAPVEALLVRFDPSRHNPYSVTAAAEFLLRRGVARERALDTVFAFGAVDVVPGFRGNPFLAELAMLALEYAPRASLVLVRRALRSNTPVNVAKMAALLASIDRAWCHRELAAALERDAQPDVSNRRVLAAALGRCHSEIAKQLAARHAPASPERAPDAIGYTWDEVAYANLDDGLGYYVSEVAPIAARLADVVPE